MGTDGEVLPSFLVFQPGVLARLRVMMHHWLP